MADALRQYLGSPLPVFGANGGAFAVNFALTLTLSRHVPMVLVDLDTGTSSVRSTVPGDVARDLYDFKRKGVPLPDRISRPLICS